MKTKTHENLDYPENNHSKFSQRETNVLMKTIKSFSKNIHMLKDFYSMFLTIFYGKQIFRPLNSLENFFLST